MPFPVDGVAPSLAAYVLDRLTDQVAVVDARGTIIAVNAAWEQFARENGGDAGRTGVGVSYLAVCRQARGRDAAQAQAVADGLAAVIAGDVPDFTFEYPCHAPGEERWFLLRIQPLPSQLGGAVVVHRAVTAEKQAAVLERFLSESFAHQLRTPLTEVQLAAQMLQRQLAAGQTPDTARLAAVLDGMTNATRQMSALLTRVQQGLQLPALHDLSLERRPTDLVPLVGDRVTMLRQRTPAPSVALDARTPRAVGTWDAARLAQALDHLLDNAVTYSAPDSPIRVVLERLTETAAPWVAIVIEDRGIGIPADDLPHVFARFYRGRNAIGHAPGTGLGLTVARQLIGLHGGTLALRSREGEGTTATVRLPVNGELGADGHGCGG